MNPMIALASNGGFNPLAVDDQVSNLQLRRAQANALMQQGRAQDFEMQQKVQGQAQAQQQQARLNSLLQSIPATASNEERANALIRGGYHEQGLKILDGTSKAAKAIADAREADGKTGKMSFDQAIKAQEYLSQAFGALSQDPALDANKVAQAIQNGVGLGILPADRANHQLAQLSAMQSPDQIRSYVVNMHNAGKTLAQQAEERKKQYFQQNNGSNNTITGVNPYTGETVEASRQAIYQSPDNAANNTRAAHEGAANRDVTMRGQDIGVGTSIMHDQTTRAGQEAKANEPKPLTEGQAKSVAYSARMQASEGVFSDLAARGVFSSVPGSRAPLVGGAITAISGSNRQMLDQAKRDWVTAILRRESGAVISDSEFDNAEKQYFPQIGDDKKTLAQKAENRRVALEGIKADIPTKSAGLPDKISGRASPQSTRQIVRTGTVNGRKVVQYSDGSTEYAQ